MSLLHFIHVEGHKTLSHFANFKSILYATLLRLPAARAYLRALYSVCVCWNGTLKRFMSHFITLLVYPNKHISAFCPLEGHLNRFSLSEGHSERHPIMLCQFQKHHWGRFVVFWPQKGHPIEGIWFLFCPIEGHPRGHLIFTFEHQSNPTPNFACDLGFTIYSITWT